MLDILGGGVLGSLLGGVFRLAPEVLKWLDKKNERNHEFAMFDRQCALEQQRGEQKLAEIGAQREAAVDTGAMDAFNAAIQQLDSAVKRLEAQVIKQQTRLAGLQKEVGYLVADLVQARADANNTPDWVLEQERINELLAESDIGFDRLAQFYGLDRHRKRS